MSLEQLARVRDHLSDEQIIAFFRAADQDKDKPTAVLIACKRLDKGATLDVIFTPFDKKKIPPRYRAVTSFSVDPMGPGLYRIAYRIQTSMLGDGGVWKVAFATDGTVKSLELESSWSK